MMSFPRRVSAAGTQGGWKFVVWTASVDAMRAREITRSNERGTREFLIDLHHLHAVDWTLLALLVRTVSSSSSHAVFDSVGVHQGTGNDVLLPESGIEVTGNHPSR